MAIPLIIAGLAAPIIGGAMSMVGGAMSMTGGVMTAGATIAGIAADAAGGVIGAAGGLLGGGKSGNVETPDTPKTPMGTYKTADGRLRHDGTKGQKGAFAPAGGGMSLAKVKSSLDPLEAEGAVSVLPTGKETQTTLLSQILGQIRTNTGLLSSMLGVLTASSVKSTVDSAKKPKGVDDPEKKSGNIVTRTFSALGGKLKSLQRGLGSFAKFALKGLALGAVFLLFNKYRDKIVGFVASVFKKIDSFTKYVMDGGNPVSDLFDTISNYVKTQILPGLKSGILFVIEKLVYALKGIINEVIPGTFMDLDNVRPVDSSEFSQISKQLANQAKDVGGATNLGNVQGGGLVGSDLDFGKLGGNEGQQQITKDLVKEKLDMMYAYVVKSGGRVKWSHLGKGFTIGEGVEGFDLHNIANVLRSRPIIDGKLSTNADLQGLDVSNMINPFEKGSLSSTQYSANMSGMSKSRQNLLFADNRGFTNAAATSQKNIEFYQSKNRVLTTPSNTTVPTDGSVIFTKGNTTSQVNHNGDTITQRQNVSHTEPTAQAVNDALR